MKKIAFSVSIFKYKVQNWDVKKKQLLDLFHEFPHRVVGNVITSPKNIHTDLLNDEIKLFEKEVGINLYTNSTTGVWFQKYEQNMDHSVHDHGKGGFSAVCFVEYDKNYHSPTTFISPFLDQDGKRIKYHPDVEEGDIIFFPSNLSHYAPTNPTNKTRIVMSLNLKIQKFVYK